MKTLFQRLAAMPPVYLFLAIALSISVESCGVTQQGEGDGTTVYRNYVPPPWAPPYDNVSTVRYYYLPDYELYYDVWDGAFWYPNGGGWVSSVTLPPAYAEVDLIAAFVVLIDRDEVRPWEHHSYYRDNYPRGLHEHYRNIVVRDRIISNVPQDRELVPRAYNENSNRVTFMQRPIMHEPPTPPSQAQLSQPPPPPGAHVPVAVRPPTVRVYDRVVHEVPMKAITPSMPAESKKFNYGSGYVKGSKKQ